MILLLNYITTCTTETNVVCFHFTHRYSAWEGEYSICYNYIIVVQAVWWVLPGKPRVILRLSEVMFKAIQNRFILCW